ncbi:MAG: Fic family protein [Candidatus Babeliaceae bacterium]|jgi:Fic family protein
MRITGKYEQLGAIKYFIPEALPPQNPPFIMSAEIAALYGEAMLQLGKLNEMAHRLPNQQRFIKAYIIKEALLSSSIEGIQTTLIDVFTQHILESKPNKNTQLVMNYTEALYAALEMINQGLPVSSRIILNTHYVLMNLGEGDKANPGNYRKQAVKVGNLVPPPTQYIPQLLSDLEYYINTDETLPPLIKAGLAHVQFETIHPFLDGNGRIGRLLIVLMLVDSNLLSKPILYPSYYFKKHHLEYYHHLDKVRTDGDFENWIIFYLKAIKDSSIDAYQRAQEIESLWNDLTSNMTDEKKLRALSVLFNFPIINISELAQQLHLSYNTANAIIKDFLQQNIIIEENQQKRGKLFKFAHYFTILEKEY